MEKRNKSMFLAASVRKIFCGVVLALVLFFADMPLMADVVHLKNGDRVTGALQDGIQDFYTVETESMGTVSIAKANVECIERSDDKAISEAKDRSSWSVVVEGGFSQRRGNTRDTGLSTKLAASRKTDKDEWTFKGNGYYSKSEQKMDAQEYGGVVRYAQSFGRDLKWYNFYSGEGDHDRFANIDSRWTPTVGLGYWFSDEAPFKLMMEAGGGATYTDFRDETRDSTEGVIVPRIFSEVTLWKKATLSEDFSIYPSITESGEYRLRSEAVLDLPVTDELALRLSLINDYNSAPGADVKKSDLRLVSSVAYKY